MNQSIARLLPALALTVAVFLWASSFVAMKVILETFDPMVMIFGRMLVACAIMAPFWRRARTRDYRQGDWRYLLFMVACEPCLYFMFEAHALRHTSASQAGMIVALLPALVAVAAFFALKERLTARTLAGFLLAMGGAVWLSLAGDSTFRAPRPLLGNSLEFLAMVMATGYIVTMKHLTSRYSPHFLTALQAVSGLLFFTPMLLLPGVHLPESLPLLPSLAVVYLGAFVTLGAYGLYNYGTSLMPANQASVFINMIPVWTVLMGWSLLGERLNSQQMLASALVLVGVFGSQAHRRRRRNLRV